MKKQIINKLLMAAVLAAVLVGTTLALPVREIENRQIENSSQQKWTQAVRQFEKISLKPSVQKGGLVSEANQMRFLVGHYLTRTIYDFTFAEMELDGSCYQVVIEDLEYLIGLFEGTPEAGKLEKLLESVQAGTADFEEIAEVMFEVGESYRAGLSEEEDWFFRYGEWMTYLIGDVILGDNENIAVDLTVLQELAKDAPEKVAEEIIKPVDDLAVFNEGNDFSDEDYEKMTAAAFEIYYLVMGE